MNNERSDGQSVSQFDHVFAKTFTDNCELKMFMTWYTMHEIDKMIEDIYSHWRYDFVIVDAANEESILSTSDLIRVLAVYNETMNINVNENQVDSRFLFKMKHLKQIRTTRYTSTT